MPRDRDFKKIVRTRMSKTGESYTAARAKLVAPTARHQTSERDPFDLLDDDAKNVLTFAQKEAAGAGAGLIGPEHVLLGLLRQRNCSAAIILRQLGVRLQAVRAAMKYKSQRRAERPEGPVAAAASTLRVIDQAILEARHRGRKKAGTEHLLLGIFCETDEAAAQVLNEMGVTAERAMEVIDAEATSTSEGNADSPAVALRSSPVATGGLAAALRRARKRAVIEGAIFFRSDHLLSELVGPGSQTPALVALLRAVGTNLDELRQRLMPPAQAIHLEAKIRSVRLREDDAIRGGDEALARELLAEEQALRAQLARALDTWNKRWAKPADNSPR